MKDLLNKYCRSEVRKIKLKRVNVHPRDIQIKNSEIFIKSYFGKRLLKNNSKLN